MRKSIFVLGVAIALLLVSACSSPTAPVVKKTHPVNYATYALATD
jgi:hypothetical protein